MTSDSWLSNPLSRSEGLVHVGMAILMALFIATGCFFQSKIAQSVEAIGSDREQCLSLCLSEPEIRGDVDKSAEQHAKLKQDYRSVLAKTPLRVVDSEVLSSIRGLSQTSHCNLIDFRPGTTQKQIDYQTRSFDLHLQGGFKSLFQFFESLQRVQFAYQIGRFKLIEPSSPGSTCRLDVELKVVFDHVETRQE